MSQNVNHLRKSLTLLWEKQNIKLRTNSKSFRNSTSPKTFSQPQKSHHLEVIHVGQLKKYLSLAQIELRPEDQRFGRPGYGERKLDGVIVSNKSEREIRKKARAFKAEGLSNEKIAEILESFQISTKRGGRWTKKTITLLYGSGLKEEKVDLI